MTSNKTKQGSSQKKTSGGSKERKPQKTPVRSAKKPTNPFLERHPAPKRAPKR